MQIGMRHEVQAPWAFAAITTTGNRKVWRCLRTPGERVHTKRPSGHRLARGTDTGESLRGKNWMELKNLKLTGVS
jgi:hypothetical protein